MPMLTTMLAGTIIVVAAIAISAWFILWRVNAGINRLFADVDTRLNYLADELKAHTLTVMRLAVEELREDGFEKLAATWDKATATAERRETWADWK